MLTSQRIIFSDNGTLSDVSAALGDYRTGTLTPAYTVSQDYLYIGSEYPFNHKWIDVGTANAVASTVTVEIWKGGAWVPAVDVIDGTKASTASLSQDGFIRWTPDIDNSGWTCEQKSGSVTGLSATAIYNFYWVRFSWNATLTAGTTITYVGNKFSNDAQLFSFYPALNNTSLMAKFAGGKTDWNEQAYAASDTIIRYLKSKGVIFSDCQILDYEVLNEACIHKTAEIIFGGLGAAYAEHAKLASQRFSEGIDVKYFNIDTDGDAEISPAEKTYTTGWLSR